MADEPIDEYLYQSNDSHLSAAAEPAQNCDDGDIDGDDDDEGEDKSPKQELVKEEGAAKEEEEKDSDDDYDDFLDQLESEL